MNSDGVEPVPGEVLGSGAVDAPAIEVLYSCHSCGLVKARVTVTARTIEDVMRWMEDVLAPALGRDHYERSPHCNTRTLSDVMIPIMGASKIGGPSEN